MEDSHPPSEDEIDEEEDISLELNRTFQNPRKRGALSLSHDAHSSATPSAHFSSRKGANYSGQRIGRVPKMRLQNHIDCALKQCLLQDGHAPLLASEVNSCLHLISGFTLHSGLLRTTEQLNSLLDRTLIGNGTAALTMDLSTLVTLQAQQSANVYNDESAWSAYSLMICSSGLYSLGETKVVGCSVFTIIDTLVAFETDAPLTYSKADVNFTNIFLLTNHFFISPEWLFASLSRIFLTCGTERGNNIPESRALKLQRRVIALLASWVRLSKADISPSLLKRLLTFATTYVTRLDVDPDVVKDMGALYQLVISPEITPSRANIQHPCMESPRCRMSLDSSVMCLLDIDDVELARQYCLLSFSLFSKIRLRELEHAAWNDCDLRLVSDNLKRFVDFLSNTTLWLCWCIVSPREVEVRRLVYRKIVRAARHLYDLQNYAMLNAVYQALDHPAVTRLLAAREPLPSDEHNSLEAIASTISPFSRALKDISHKIDSPSIPLIPPYLTILCRSEESSKTFIIHRGQRKVNWTKMVEIGIQLIHFSAFQSLPYNFTLLPLVQKYLWRMSGCKTEFAISLRSKENEPT